jgi:hypothetical protein
MIARRLSSDRISVRVDPGSTFVPNLHVRLLTSRNASAALLDGDPHDPVLVCVLHRPICRLTSRPALSFSVRLQVGCPGWTVTEQVPEVIVLSESGRRSTGWWLLASATTVPDVGPYAIRRLVGPSTGADAVRWDADHLAIHDRCRSVARVVGNVARCPSGWATRRVEEEPANEHEGCHASNRWTCSESSGLPDDRCCGGSSGSCGGDKATLCSM